MTDLTLNPVEASRLVLHRAEPHARHPGGERQPGRRRRRPADPRLLEAVLPGEDPGDYEMHFELDTGAFAGVTIVHRQTGEVAARLDAETLARQADKPGFILERGA
ncbi:MAG: hypothetical protein Kow0010_19440 [Dehalococcoidia bacterium]